MYKVLCELQQEIVHLAERIRQGFKDNVTLSLIWKGKELDKQVGRR